MDIKIGDTVIVNKNGRVGTVCAFCASITKNETQASIREIGCGELNQKIYSTEGLVAYDNHVITCFAILDLLRKTFFELLDSVKEEKSKEFVRECWASVSEIALKYLEK